MFEIGDYVEFQYNSNTIIGFILGFQSFGESVCIQITKGGTFGHDSSGTRWYQKDRKTLIPYIKGNNRYWVEEFKLTLRESKIYYEIY